MRKPPVISEAKSRQTIFLFWAIGATLLALLSAGVAIFFFFLTRSAPPRVGRTKVATITLGQKAESNHMVLVNQTGDGATTATEIEGLPCHVITSEPGLPPAYFYFQLDSRLNLRQAPVLVAVDYFDATSGTISIDYDSFDEKSRNQAYTRSATRVELRKDNRWHKAVFLLEYPRFQQGMHDGGDFRIALSGSRLFVRSVVVTRE